MIDEMIERLDEDFDAVLSYLSKNICEKVGKCEKECNLYLQTCSDCKITKLEKDFKSIITTIKQIKNEVK